MRIVYGFTVFAFSLAIMEIVFFPFPLNFLCAVVDMSLSILLMLFDMFSLQDEDLENE